MSMMSGPTKGPGTYVQVLFDYEYTANDGATISIKQGEQYLLLKKSNIEWWRVIRQGEKKPIYVPANYVEEIAKSDRLKQSNQSTSVPATNPDAVKSHKEQYDVQNGLDVQVPVSSDSTSDVEENVMETPNWLSTFCVQKRDEEQNSTDDDTSNRGSVFLEEPQYANLPVVTSRPPVGSTLSPPESTEHTYANVGELPSQQIPPPKPKEGVRPVKILESCWEVHVEEESKRQYYYNTATLETTWKPPRGLRLKDPGNKNTAETSTVVKPPEGVTAVPALGTNSFGTKVKLSLSSEGVEGEECDRSLQNGVVNMVKTTNNVPKTQPDKRHSMPPTHSLPRGYSEERTDSGDVLYVNDNTDEKWLCNVDDTGRTYYYKEDGGESVWTLPKNSDEVKEKVEEEENGGDVPPPPSKPEVVRLSSLPDIYEEGILKSCRRSFDASHYCAVFPKRYSLGAFFNNAKFPERRGVLNKTKVTDNGKKVKKNWAQCFAVTRANHLYFYKNEKATTPKPNFPNGRADTDIDLRGAKVEFGSKDKSSKENVILLTVGGGTQYLLQVDDPIKIHEWYQTLSQVLFQLNPDSLTTASSSGSLNDSADSDRGIPSIDATVDEAPSSPSPTSSRFRKWSHKKSGTLDKNATLDDPNLSAPEKTSRIKERLKNFFLKRPGLEMLQERGIYKDGVFGSHIQRLCEKEKSATPRFVTKCITAIEARGLDVDGLYRVSGNLAQIQKLRFQVDQNDQYDLDNPEWDIHVLTGALKLFFRELKEPLCTFHLFDKFQNCIKISDKSSRLKAFKENIKALPKNNKDTAKELFKHLCKVIDHSHQNRMQAQNIAIVFGPTLLWPEKPSENVALTMVLQGQIVEFILQEYKQLF